MHVHRTEASPGDVCRGFKVGLGSRIAFKVLARAGIPVSNWIQLGGPPSFDVAVFGDDEPWVLIFWWLGSIEVQAVVAACCSLEVRGGTTECPAGCTTAAWAAGCHGERSRSQLLFQLGGTENTLILAVNILDVNGALPLYIVSKSVLCTPYSVKRCLIHSI